MADWDEDSATLRTNLVQVLASIRNEARQRTPPTVEMARAWQLEMMRGLAAPKSGHAGRFRGERGLKGYEVAVGDTRGVSSDRVPDALGIFEARLQNAVSLLDGLIEADSDLNADQLAAIIDLSAWAHAEWVRIHPFANGNGRTARLWANAIAMRYGLPPFVRLRPRPGDAYGEAAAAAMEGDWQPTALVFRQMYRETIRRRPA